MKSEAISALFDELFKSKMGDSVCHKADNKSHTGDMGMLVLHRVLCEIEDDEGNRFYERSYHCRMVKFSGSGEIANFKERELMTREEWLQQTVQDEEERQRMRNEVKQAGKDIYKAFGVTESSRMYLKTEAGEVDKTVLYRPSGWSRDENGIQLNLHEVDTLTSGNARTTVKHPDQFVLQTDETP